MENGIGGYFQMRRIKILWIDNDKSRNDHLKSMRKFSYRDKYDNAIYKDAECNFINVTKKTIEDILKDIKLSYDVIIVDHFLDGVKGVAKLGMTWAGFLREMRVAAPIVCVTAAEKKEKVSKVIFNEYDDLFSENDIGDYFENIFSIAVGFRRIKELSDVRKEKVIELLKPPDNDIEILKQIIPDIGSEQYIVARNIYKWFRTDFAEMPGFLYDQRWTANLIGINEKSFIKVENIFCNAEYTGIFSAQNNRLWWRSMIKNIVFAHTLNRNAKTPWEAGHGIKKIRKEDYSVCFKCKELFPETMGYDDGSTTRKFVPLHFRCSLSVADSKKQLFFDEIRQMKTSKDK
jgi:hypothetical protein